MNLGQVVSFFNSVPISVFSDGAWTGPNKKATVRTYDRTYTGKSADKDRLLIVGSDEGPLDEAVEAVKLPDGTIFIIVSRNADYRNGAPYAYYYSMRRADYTLDIIEFTEDEAASGLASGVFPSLVDTVFGDVEPSGSVSSTEFADTDYGRFEITLPYSMAGVVTSDHVIQHGSIRYKVELVQPTTDSLLVQAVIRSAG